MTFFAELRRELAACGVEPRRVRRIVLELEDHLACDSEAKLGEPGEIAVRFADELRIVRTRRAAVGGFASLSWRKRTRTRNGAGAVLVESESYMNRRAMNAGLVSNVSGVGVKPAICVRKYGL